MSERWFYRLNNEEFGPVVGEQVIELIRSQILTSTDWIRAENASGWSPLGRIDNFREELDQARSDDLEIAGSLDDLTFEFAETSSSNSGFDSASSRIGRQHGSGIPDRTSNSDKDAILETAQPQAAAGAPAQHEVKTVAPEFDSRAAVADTEELSADDSDQGRKSRPQASRKQASQTATGERKKVKRKTSEPEDPLLDEIIRELSERGKSESPSSATPARQAFTPTSMSTSSPAPTASATIASTPALSARPVSNLSPPVSNSTPKMNSYTPPVVKPAPVRARQSFQMPEPKTIGIVGGGLVSVLLATALMLGWVSLPFSNSGGALPGNAGTVVSCYLEFKQFGTAIPAGPEWAAFRSTVEKNIKPVVETSADAKDNVTEAGRKLIELASLQPTGNPEKVKQLGGELEVLIAGIVDTN